MSLIFAKPAMIIIFKSILHPVTLLYQPRNQDYWNFYQKLTRDFFVPVYAVTRLLIFDRNFLLH